MAEKRYKLYEHNECDYILDNPNESLDFIEMLGDALSSEEIVDRLNEQSETIQQLQSRIKSLDKPLTQIMLLLLDDEIRSKLTDVEWKAFEELSKFNGDIK